MERKVYFLQGHGEREPNKTERDGYSAVSGSLRKDNYMVERLVLAQMKEVPDDATVVLIPGPTSDILPTEAEALRRYLAKAGKLMVMLDPPIGANAAPLPNLEGILKEWGITPGNNVVVDISGATNDPSIAVAATYPQHAITETFRDAHHLSARAQHRSDRGRHERARRDSDRRDDARQLGRVEPRVADRRRRRLDGRGERRQARAGRARRSPCRRRSKAPPRPSTPATGEALKPETRVVVFGDSDFASNAYAGGALGNMNLFANAISWLAQQENLIAIRPTEAADRRVTMTPQQQTMAVICVDFRAARRWSSPPASSRGGGGGNVGGLRSTIVLLVLLVGIGGYIYFVESERDPAAADAKPKAFTELAADTIEEIRIKNADGETSHVQRVGDNWQLVEPNKADADARRRRHRHQQPVDARGPARRRRESGGPEAVRARAGAHRPVVPSEGPEGLPAAARRRQDADRRRRVREAAEREAGVPDLVVSSNRSSTRARSTCATRRSSSSTGRRRTASP